MSDPTPPPGSGDQYPPADQPGGAPPPAPPPPPDYPPQPSYPQQPPQGYPQQPPAGYPPPQPQGYPPPQPGYQPPPDYGQQPYGQPAYPPQPYGAPAGGSGGNYVTLMSGTTVKVADGGKRAIGRIIDAVIVGVVLGILYGIVVAGVIGTSETTFNAETNEFETSGLGGLGVLFATIALLSVLSILYEVAFVAVKGQTPGKMIIGTKIVNQASGELIGWGPAFMRWLPIGIGNFVCGLGWLVYFTAFLDKSGRLQGWHDNMAKDLVIDIKA